jgi:hypothetical protein
MKFLIFRQIGIQLRAVLIYAYLNKQFLIVKMCWVHYKNWIWWSVFDSNLLKLQKRYSCVILSVFFIFHSWYKFFILPQKSKKSFLKTACVRTWSELDDQIVVMRKIIGRATLYVIFKIFTAA